MKMQGMSPTGCFALGSRNISRGVGTGGGGGGKGGLSPPAQ